MASCLVLNALLLLLLLLLHGLEVTLQFSSPMGNLETTNDLVRCTVQLIREYQSDADTLRIYGSVLSTSPISEAIRKSFFESNDQLINVISTNYDFNEMPSLIVAEQICLSVVNSPNELKSLIDKLYYKLHHKRAIICLSYNLRDPLRHLLNIVRKIWSTGIPRNIIFITPNHGNKNISIIGVPQYAKENCKKIKLKQVRI